MCAKYHGRYFFKWLESIFTQYIYISLKERILRKKGAI